jgi:hypothetical protein
MENQKEVWLPVKGYEGIYEVSNLGRVKSLKRKKILIDIILKPNVNKYGYKYIVLSKNKDKKTFAIHRLVALCFIDNDKNKPCVNHINGVKTNNFVHNLEWCTYSENINHALKIGLRKDVSENHWNNKLSKKDVVDIKKLLGKETQKEIAKRFKINQSTVSDIKLGKIRRYE